ncbi:MAG: hypothetical protein KAR40_12325 [Candidatus Sabulitectum sp.]|nr:hypothetical protein [Candidatus Sabulitectum sp.]
MVTYGGEEDIMPPFYTADYFSISGDSIFVSDDAVQTLVCMTLDGTVQWKAGELGEGPGHFLGIGRSAVSDEYIAVCNNGGCAIDLYSRAGEFVQRIPSISSPQDVKFLSDSTLIVFSKSQPGGDVHVVSIISGDIEESFGDGEWTVVTRNRAPRDLSGIVSSDGKVAYISQFEYKLIIYNLDSHSLVFRGGRQLPMDMHDEIVGEIDEEGTRRGVLFPIPGMVFTGPEGMINITMPRLLADGQLPHDLGPYDYAPVTLVDRYDWDGTYLDSYSVPDSMLMDMSYSEEYGLIARQMRMKVIQRFVEIDNI